MRLFLCFAPEGCYILFSGESCIMKTAFLIWSLTAAALAGISLYCRRAEKPVGFWANVNAPEVSDLKQYNREVSRLWAGYACIFELLGIPFLFLRQNSPLFLITGLGVVFSSLILMVMYTHIEAKYRK